MKGVVCIKVNEKGEREKRLEKEIERYKKELRESEKRYEKLKESTKRERERVYKKIEEEVKSTVISHISHHLRTPLASIKIAITLLEKESNEEKRARYLSILKEECNKEIEYVNSLLDLQS